MNNIIKERRKHKGLSQEELAKKCKVTRQTIIAIENNKYDPSLQLAFTLAYVLDISIEQLFIFRCEGIE